MNATQLKAKFEAGLDYPTYVATGNPAQQEAWNAIHARVMPTTDEQELLSAFERTIHVLVVSGIWCGDCVRQGPMIQRIADATSGKAIVRWLDRDQHMDLQEQVTINAGKRVPVAIFCAEDFEPVAWFGDKPLSRYRLMAQQALGANCPLPHAVELDEPLAAERAEWVEQFERVHLLLRLSGRLRKLHGD